MADETPRVNAARLSKFVGRTVRLPCKVLSRNAEGVLVEACDGGQVQVILNKNLDQQVEGTFAEVIGKVENESTLKFLLSLNLDSDKEFDMKLVNDVVELTFDPRFTKMFSSIPSL